MAKNKLRGPKSRNVFHIASQKNFKAKNKAKPVTTNLKKINIMNEEKINRVNKAFVDVQKELAHFSKGLSLDPLQKELLMPTSGANELNTVKSSYSHENRKKAAYQYMAQWSENNVHNF
uniref:Ribosomal biosis factor n=1 Tax=Callithrix jacchus TaxID=9483 RepID=A0A8I3W3B0_CALJA